MRSTIAVFVAVFAVLGLLLGFSQSYDAPQSGIAQSATSGGLGAASRASGGPREPTCPVDPRAEARGADPEERVGVRWSGCDLSGADLSNLVLTGAGLSRADLSNANLSGANLSGAKLDSVPIVGLGCINHPICKR